MIYLFSQIAISLGLAAIVGGALGWIAHRARAGKQIRALQQVVTRQQQQVSQAQTEVSILTDDFDDLKAHSASEINALTVENQKIPALNQNLEKSQLLVRQLMQKHTAEISELELANEKLLSKSKQVNDREREFTKLQAELDIERRKNGKPPLRKSETATEQKQTELGLSVDDNASTTKAEGSQDKDGVASESHNGTEAGLNKTLGATLGVAGLTATAGAALSADTPSDSDTHQNSNTQSNAVEFDATPSDTSQANTTQADIALTNVAQSSNSSWSSKSITDVGSKAQTEAELKALRDQLAEPLSETQEKPADSAAVTAGNYDAGRPHNLDETTVDEEELKQLFDPVDQQDDLKQIFGIGPVTEKTLNKLGITAYSQLADLKQHDIEKIANALQIFPGRIERDNWVGGARAQLEEVLEDL